MGIGIHGEPGRTRAPLAPARDLAAAALDAIRADMPLSGDLLVMVNGMGGTPLLELYVLFNEVQRYLEGQGARIARNLVGNYITSLEMQGFSVTVCQLTDDTHTAVGRPGGHTRPALGTLASTVLPERRASRQIRPPLRSGER